MPWVHTKHANERVLSKGADASKFPGHTLSRPFCFDCCYKRKPLTVVNDLFNPAGLLLEVRRPDDALTRVSELVQLNTAATAAATAAAAAGGARFSSVEKTAAATEKAALTARLAEIKAVAAWQKTPDHYKLLGLERAAT